MHRMSFGRSSQCSNDSNPNLSNLVWFEARPHCCAQTGPILDRDPLGPLELLESFLLEDRYQDSFA